MGHLRYSFVRYLGFGLFALMMLALGAPASAQMSTDDLADTGPRDEAVQKSMSWERVEDELIYLRPAVPFDPDGSLEIEIPEKPKPREERINEFRWTWIIILGAIILMVLAIFLMQGSRIQVGFRQSREGNRAEDRNGSKKVEDTLSGDVSGFPPRHRRAGRQSRCCRACGHR